MSKRKRVAFWALLIFVSVLFAATIKPYLHDRNNNAEVSRADVSSDESAEDADSGENPSDEVPLSEQERQIEEAQTSLASSSLPPTASKNSSDSIFGSLKGI